MNSPSITVMSFAYDVGLPVVSPQDRLYVVDCRTIKDPMYMNFTTYTGLDPELRDHFAGEQPMIDFLDQITRFLCFVADQARTGNDQRNCIIAFGCTHGRHRSVYCADMIASALAHHCNRPIECIHREQGISEQKQ